MKNISVSLFRGIFFFWFTVSLFFWTVLSYSGSGGGDPPPGRCQRVAFGGAQNILESIIRKVSSNKTIPLRLTSCKANCFQIESSLTNSPRVIRIDPDLAFPFQESHTLITPPPKRVNPVVMEDMIRRLLIGHELHPYISIPSEGTTLRPVQQMAIDSFRESLDFGYRSFLHVAPTSIGKGIVLARNLLEKLGRESSKKISFITVDKIKIVDQLTSEIQSEAQKVNFHLKQLHWVASEGKSFAEEVHQALSSERPTVVTITSKSFMIQLEKLREEDSSLYEKLLENLDGIYIDEVHHLGAPRTLNFVLDLQNRTQTFVYGSTATPVHRDVEIQNLFQKVHWSYLEERGFDKYPPSMVVGQLRRSIEKGDITPFNDIYVLLGEDMANMRNTPFFIQRGNSSFFSINPQYYGQVKENLSGIFESHKKGMIIVSTIKEAEDITSFFNKEVNGITFEAYHSDMRPEQREAVFENSREQETHYIVAVRALDEGVNLPHLSAYIDLNSHVSVKQMVHRMGRVLRPALGKLRADIFVLFSYRNFEATQELMNNVMQIREAVISSNDGISPASPQRQRLREMADRSYDLFLQHRQFWLSGRQRRRAVNEDEDNSLFEDYFNYATEVRRQLPRLSSERQDALIQEFKRTGDIKIRNEIISRNLGLVNRVVLKYRWALSSTIDMMDLVQVGNEGLINAMEAYNPELGYRFSTLAVPYIEGAIKTFCYEEAHIVRLPDSNERIRVFFNLERQRDYFASEGIPFNEHLAAENLSTGRITVRPKTVRRMDSHLQDTISFDQPVTERRDPLRSFEEDLTEETRTFEEVYNPRNFSTEDVAAAEQVLEGVRRHISHFLSKLPPRQQDIFIKRFLISPAVPLIELAEAYGVSTGYVNQVERRLIGKFKRSSLWRSDLMLQVRDMVLFHSPQRFISDVNDYTERYFGRSFYEYFYSTKPFEEVIKHKEVIDFFERHFNSFLSELSPLEKDIFEKVFNEHTRTMRTFDDIVSAYNDIVSAHNIPATRIRAIWTSLLHRLRFKIVASRESSGLINRFRDELSLFLDAHSFEMRLRSVLESVRETRQENARKEGVGDETASL